MTTISIGEFARLSHLSIKQLRHYHDQGVLLAARVDPSSGYRYYDPDQVTDAQLVRRLRDLDMGLPTIREMLRAGAERRLELLRDHMDDLQRHLTHTSEAVTSLQALLEPRVEIAVEHRQLAAQRVLLVRERVAHDAIEAWCERSFTELYQRLGDRLPAGPAGATYDLDWFENECGEVVAYLPVVEGDDTEMLAGFTCAIAIHAGPFTDFDRTYGALGRHVAHHDESLPDPIREIYLIGPPHPDPRTWRTEVCWPIRMSPTNLD